MDLGLAGRTILVTGAGRDLGAATAAVLEREGATVVAAGRELDLAEADVVDAAVADLVARHGRLDGVVNTVGPFPRDPEVAVPATADDASWLAAFDAVFLTAARLTRAALVPMGRQRAGAVVHVLAASARTTSPPTAQFGAMKAALAHAVRSWAQLGAAEGVRVNGILPGWIRTERADGRIRARAAADGVDEVEAERRILAEHPAPFWSDRMGRLDEYADLLALLVSDRTSYVNGALIAIDGGGPAG